MFVKALFFLLFHRQTACMGKPFPSLITAMAKNRKNDIIDTTMSRSSMKALIHLRALTYCSMT